MGFSGTDLERGATMIGVMGFAIPDTTDAVDGFDLCVPAKEHSVAAEPPASELTVLAPGLVRDLDRDPPPTRGCAGARSGLRRSPGFEGPDAADVADVAAHEVLRGLGVPGFDEVEQFGVLVGGGDELAAFREHLEAVDT
jgi:hypothetical protein